MALPALTRFSSQGVTLLGDTSSPGGVTFAFTERSGGVSQGAYASLNIGAACGDDLALVTENRRRVLAAIGAEDAIARLVNPHQVHGDRVVVVRESDEASIASARADVAVGADAVVCTAEGVPVLLGFADCVPVVVCAPHGFAVAHSGWKGTELAISAKAARVLMDETGASASELSAYVGPHITSEHYEVSPELAERFRSRFGDACVVGERNLDLGYCVRSALTSAGIPPERVVDPNISTFETERFFSYRASGGHCGRHGAVAFIRPMHQGGPAQEGAGIDGA